jgi:C1A family cysteine protease
MTDWTPEEIKSRKNLKQLDDSVKTIRVPPTNGRLGAALSYDWRDQGAVTSIKNQAGCGACTTFASAAVAESFLIISKRFTNTTINLS